MSGTKRHKISYSRAVSRRRFLRTALGSGAVLGLAGLGGLGLVARANEKSGATGNKVADTKGAGQVKEPEKEPESKPDAEKLGEYRTDYLYSDSPDRKYNLRMSAEAVNGTVIPPGGIFSMNDRLEGLDYKSAKVFADGGESMADGGGLCQVTSTVYMAAQYAGLEIVERNAHYTVLPYIRPGFDATIWFGYNGTEELDMKLRNDTGSDVEIREYVTEDGFLVAEVWGVPTGKKVTMRSEEDFQDLNVGIQWSTYKKVEKDGEVLRDGLLHIDLYSYPPPEAAGGKGYNEVRTGGW
ncbi:MAG: VanW family protein [Rubrobacteraceae bacterium]